MDVEVKDISLNVKSILTLNKDVFGSDVNEFVVYDAIKNSLANKRQGTSSSQVRGEVSRTTKKPFNQKGLGRARAGSARSPLWKGGAVVFGPRPRDFSYNLPKKIRRNAFCSVWSLIRRENRLVVLENFYLEGYSTKVINDILSKVSRGESKKKLLFVVDSADENYGKLLKSSRNISWVKVVNVDSVELVDLFYAKCVVCLKSSIEKINNRY